MPNNIKGALNGLCNRTDCQKPGAVYYNHSTREHYCKDCANMLNAVNRTDAMRMFGHDLCTLVEDITKKEALNWWNSGEVSFQEKAEMCLKHFGSVKVFDSDGTNKLTDEEIKFIYEKEHPQKPVVQDPTTYAKVMASKELGNISFKKQ